MKNFIGFVFLCLLIINSVFANELRITGKGKTFDEAKQNAFRTAVEFKVGSVVTGERESYNSRLVRDEIIVYSAGYVERYKLIDQFMSGNEVIVIMDILVSDSKIAQRLLGQGSTNNQFDGSNFIRVLYPKEAFMLIEVMTSKGRDLRCTLKILDLNEGVNFTP